MDQMIVNYGMHLMIKCRALSLGRCFVTSSSQEPLTASSFIFLLQSTAEPLLCSPSLYIPSFWDCEIPEVENYTVGKEGKSCATPSFSRNSGCRANKQLILPFAEDQFSSLFLWAAKQNPVPREGRSSNFRQNFL
jgi:hypothetical protein